MRLLPLLFASLCVTFTLACLADGAGQTGNGNAGAGDSKVAVSQAGAAAPALLRTDWDWQLRPQVFVGGEDAEGTWQWLRQGSPLALSHWNRFAEHVAEIRQESAEPYNGGEHEGFRFAAQRDAVAAADLALYYELTGDSAALQLAKERLLAWAVADPLPGSKIPVTHYPPKPGNDPTHFANRGINFAIPLASFANAYALLSPYLSEAEHVAMRNWLLYLTANTQFGFQIWVNNDYFNEQHFNNHLTTQMLGLAAAGFALGDEELVNYVYESPRNPRNFKALTEGVILMAAKGPEQFNKGDPSRQTQDGEIYDRYRVVTRHNGQSYGIGYSNVQMKALLLLAEIARVNELDCWQYVGSHGESLELSYEFMAPILISGNAEARGPYYKGNRVFITMAGNYNLARSHYPQSEAIIDVLRARPGFPQEDEYMGFSLGLLHQRELPEPTTGN